MHLVSISKVIGCLASGLVGWVFWMPLMIIDVWEFAMSAEGEPKKEFVEELDSMMLLVDHTLPHRKAATTKGYNSNNTEDVSDCGIFSNWAGHVDANQRPW